MHIRLPTVVQDFKKSCHLSWTGHQYEDILDNARKGGRFKKMPPSLGLFFQIPVKYQWSCISGPIYHSKWSRRDTGTG